MAVFVIGARTPEGWDFLFEQYRRSLQMSVKSRMKSAMSVSPLQDKLRWCVGHTTPFSSLPLFLFLDSFTFYFFSRRMMEQSLHGELMKTQDLPGVVISVSKNPRGYKLAWDFLRANWPTLIKKSVGPSCIHPTRLSNYVCSKNDSPKCLKTAV